MAKSKKKTKLSRFGKLARVFNISSTRGKMLVFLLSFVIVGGGYMAYKSFAATSPPSSLSTLRYFDNVKASDGYSGAMWCMTISQQTGYGRLAYNCFQEKWGAVRLGTYSIDYKTFLLETGSLKGAAVRIVRNCWNMNNKFISVGSQNTVYGQIYYGYVYVYSGKWLVKKANYSPTTNACSPSGDWFRPLVW